jgi:serine-type D-Ala-D-Ala carboxypeptidase/endopeptidase
MPLVRFLIGWLCLFCAFPATAKLDETLAASDAEFQRWMTENHVPGLVWGVVQDGKLVHVRAMGVQNIESQSPVTANTAFRIASMSKAFTGYAILKLRDQGKLRLDDPVWKHVPEIRKWGSDITISDLLYHNAGFVTDDPWGDRQQPMTEADFSRFVSSPVPRSTSRGVRFEYSNLGYALLGRVISNTSRQNFSRFIGTEVFKPLGMAATTYEVRDIPRTRLALGYRWENEAWLEEPMMAHGAFGSMGGVVTTANDYAKWIAFLLSGFQDPPGDRLQKPTLREMQYGGGFPQARTRPGKSAPECRLAAVYAKGLISGNDCVLGSVLFHGGGFPGYGSHMLLIPDTGTGVFAFTNRTYAGPSPPVWDAATALFKANLLSKRPSLISVNLNAGYAAARQLWQNRNFKALDKGLFAMNFFMDRDEALWQERLADWQSKLGPCNVESAIAATGQLSGTFEWPCAKGKVKGAILLAPTADAQIQSLTINPEFAKAD